MTTDSIITNKGKNVLLYRAYTENGSLSSTEYLPPTQFKVGILNGTPSVSDTNLDYPVPISNGTVCDNGDNQLTGSSGGDNTTDNTTTYKEGAGASDVTAQNLIANNTNTTKIWTIADLDTNGNDAVGTQPFGLWLYIKDSTALAKFKSSGACLEIKIGSDSSNYYSKTWTFADLAVGWNWITSNTTNVEDLTETGTVSGDLDTFIIEITTNNATDTFVAGDVVYDLLRQWGSTDLIDDFVSGYPTFDYTDNEVTIRCFLTSTNSNGFDINGLGIFNEDSSVLMTDESTFTAESKSSTDEFAFVIKNRIL